MTGSRPLTPLVRIGRWFFGAGVVGEGIRQAWTGGFPRLVPVAAEGAASWPPWGHVLLGAMLVAAGLSIALDRRARLGAALVAVVLASVFLFAHVPVAATAPLVASTWTNPLKTLALLGGAVVVVVAPGSGVDGAGRNPGARLRPAGRYALGAFLAYCGVEHFIYAGFIDTLVPAWISPGPRPWTYLAGLALVAGGVGLLVRRTAPIAALLSALMVFLWVLLVHIPRAVGMRSVFELDGVFEALAVSGVGLLVAGTLSLPSRRQPPPPGRR